MGGCATKPKVLKDAPAPEPANDDKPSAAPEPPVVVVVDVTEGEKIDAKKEDDDNVKEIVDDDKRRSLSILFKENEEGKDSTEDGKPAVEPLKQEEVPPVNIKPTYESETTLLEVEKTEILVEQSQQTPVPDVVVDHAQKREIPVELIPAPHVVDHAHKSETPVQHTNVESEKITESTAPTAETNTAEKKTEVPDVVYAPHEKAETEKTTESTAPTAETKTAEKKTEVPDVEREKAVVEAAPTPEEKKKEAPDVGSAKEEVKAEKAIEAAVGTTETQNYGTSEEKKTEVNGSHAPEEKAINV